MDIDKTLQQIHIQKSKLSDSNKSIRRQALQELKTLIIQEPPLKQFILNDIVDDLFKILLKKLSDESEKCRELSLTILIYCMKYYEDIAKLLPYMFPVLVTRLNAVDLEGVLNLPEQMRPKAPQKAQQIKDLVEPSEENRLLIAQLVTTLIQKTQTQLFANYLDELTSVLKALCMDP